MKRDLARASMPEFGIVRDSAVSSVKEAKSILTREKPPLSGSNLI
jgi:hypothetical protein